jgi:hypothetical protein
MPWPELVNRKDGGDLTPVIARLGPVDLEALNAQIIAGIASTAR